MTEDKRPDVYPSDGAMRWKKALRVYGRVFLNSLGVFVGLSLTTTSTNYLTAVYSQQSAPYLDLLYYHGRGWLNWSFIVPVIYFVSKHAPFSKKRWVWPLILHAILSLIWMPVYYQLNLGLDNLFRRIPHLATLYPYSAVEPIKVLFDYQWYWIVVVGVHAILFYQMQQARKEEAHQLELRNVALSKDLAESRLLSLKSQLRPHFFFNLLNSISALIRKGEDDKALQMIGNMSKLMRKVLNFDSQLTIALTEELYFLKAYIDIMKIRYGNRVEVTLEIAPGAEAGRVPVMMLQPLLENAYNHGIGSAEETCDIRFSVAHIGGDLVLEIQNDQNAQSIESKGFGVALENTRERLEILYPGQSAVNLDLDPNQKARVRVRIPFVE